MTGPKYMENLVVSVPLLFLDQSTSSSGAFLELKCQAMKRNRPHQGSSYRIYSLISSIRR